MGNTKSQVQIPNIEDLYPQNEEKTSPKANVYRNELRNIQKRKQQKKQRYKLLKQGIENGFDSQLMEKNNQHNIGKGMYGSIYKRQDNKFIRKIPLLMRGEGIVSTIRNLKELQQDFQTINSQNQTAYNIWSLLVAENEVNNYKYISERDEIKEYFPLFIKNVGIVSYIEFLEGYITFKEFLMNPQNKVDKKKELKKRIVNILKEFHRNGFYHRDLYSLENIMIEKNTHNIKFIDLGISLNGESIKNYSDEKLKKFLNHINENSIPEEYKIFGSKYLGEESTKTLPKEELYNILANADIFMFEKSYSILK